MAKRANNEGSIFQLKNGKWRAAITVASGKQATRTVDTQKLAVDALKALRGEADSGVVVRGDITVGDIIDEWQTKDEAGSSRTHGTKASNAGHLDAWRRTLGTQKLARVGIIEVEAAMVKMNDGRKRPLSKETMTKRRSVLNQVYAAAIRRRHCGWNPAAQATLPPDSWDTEERRSLTVDQAQQLIAATADRRGGAAYLLGLSLGLRPGELFGLCWDAVDFKRGTIHVHRAVSMETGRPVLMNRTKNQGAVRTLTMPAFVADALTTHQLRQRDEVHADGWVDRGLLFPNDLGAPMDLLLFAGWFRATCAALGFGDDWCPNEMRHTAASLLIDAGLPLELVAQTLGHKSTRMVEKHYRHAQRAERSHHVAAMQSMFGAAPAKRKRAPARVA